MAELKAALAGTVDPRNLPRRFPFLTVGAVAAASFAAAVVAIPSREQQELKRLERIRKAMYPDPEPAKASAGDGEKPTGKPTDKTPLWVTLVKEGIQAARPLLVALVTASIKAKQQQPDPVGDPGATTNGDR